MITTPPKSSEAEVTLIGTGGGYGESIVIKFGIDSWAIIDSCINPYTKEPLALEYLTQIHADLSKIRIVLCTHWHNDHINGLSKILSKAPNAELCFSNVYDLKQFILLLELDEAKSKKGSKSATNELKDCIDILITRTNPYYKELSSDMLIDNLIENDTTFNLWALSPSPKTCQDFKSELSTLINDYGKRTSPIVNKKPNDKSIAVLFSFGKHRVLLGGDLEVGNSDFEGWRHIVKHSKIIDSQKANLYKLPHHGSENAYLNEIFDILVNENSILKTTPFKIHGLPTNKMLDVYSSHSPEIYLTSPLIISKKAKKRDKSLEKFIDSTAISISEIKYAYGVVRSRIDYVKENTIWHTEIYEGAIKLVK